MKKISYPTARTLLLLWATIGLTPSALFADTQASSKEEEKDAPKNQIKVSSELKNDGLALKTPGKATWEVERTYALPFGKVKAQGELDLTNIAMDFSCKDSTEKCEEKSKLAVLGGFLSKASVDLSTKYQGQAFRLALGKDEDMTAGVKLGLTEHLTLMVDAYSTFVMMRNTSLGLATDKDNSLVMATPLSIQGSVGDFNVTAKFAPRKVFGAKDYLTADLFKHLGVLKAAYETEEDVIKEISLTYQSMGASDFSYKSATDKYAPVVEEPGIDLTVALRVDKLYKLPHTKSLVVALKGQQLFYKKEKSYSDYAAFAAGASKQFAGELSFEWKLPASCWGSWIASVALPVKYADGFSAKGFIPKATLKYERTFEDATAATKDK